MIEYKGHLINTKYNKKEIPERCWKAFTDNEQSYSNSEEHAIEALKEKIDFGYAMMENLEKLKKEKAKVPIK